MSDLWGKNPNYSLRSTYAPSFPEILLEREKYLPYLRKYRNLNKESLQTLIQLAKLYRWEALDLSNCGLNHLPDELWELTDLRILYLGNMYPKFGPRGEANRIRHISQKIEKLTNLQALCLKDLDCHFDKDAPLNLPNLHFLDFRHDLFRSEDIPKALFIPSISDLAFVCFDKHLPPELMTLLNIEALYLQHSRIVDLPDNIDQLQKLQCLDISFTNIQTLPSSMVNLQKFHYIYLDHTPLAESIPPEIQHQSSKDIIRYVLSQQSHVRKETLNESKLIIVGQGSVGKTCLLKRLIDNTYDEEAKSTEGIDIHRWDYQWEKKDYRLSVWDFGGQEIYHSTHQFFLTKRSIYLLVWDAFAEREYGRLDYWLRTIQSLADDSPIIIVVNKCDKDNGRFERIDYKEYKSKYPQILDILYVSCKDNINIDELRILIKKESANLPLMQIKWLKTWMDVRREIEELASKRDYIPYSEYLEICTEKRIADEDEALSLIKCLHDLGIVLYYHDDSLLRNIVILSSEWGTDAVYKVLDEQERRLKGKNGVLSVSYDLPSIWEPKEKYPPAYYPHLLNLMEKFQLAFKIDQDSYLIAELLNNQSINLKWEFKKAETLSFRYDYDFMPAGIMTKLIVSMNLYLLSNDDGVKQCWKKGAYLQYISARALVRLFDDFSHLYIQIDVIGENARDKRELLSIIRIKLSEINNRYNKLNIKMKVPCCCSEDCDFLFDYQTLRKAEEIGKETVECHRSLIDVPVSSLLDGVGGTKGKESRNEDSTYSLEMTDPIYEAKLQGINRQLYLWASNSELYKKAVKSTDLNALAKALGPNETERYQATYQILECIWSNHPELGLMPDYCFLSKMEHGGAYYPGYRDHLTHMFKVYLLGLFLYEKDETIGQMTEEEFFPVWTLCALWHDVGYLIETEDGARDSKDASTAFRKFNERLSFPLAKLYPLGSFLDNEPIWQKKYTVYPDIIDSLADCEEKLSYFDSYGKSVQLTHDDNTNPIKEYYHFIAQPRTERNYYDHGIVSASFLLFICDSLRNYMNKSKAFNMYKDEEKKRDAFLSTMDSLSCYVQKAAIAIALHNITKDHNDTCRKELIKKGVTISNFSINKDTEPYAWLLRVCDETQCWDRQYFIEPIDNPKSSLSGSELQFDDTALRMRFVHSENKAKIVKALQSVIVPLPSFLDD